MEQRHDEDGRRSGDGETGGSLTPSESLARDGDLLFNVERLKNGDGRSRHISDLRNSSPRSCVVYRMHRRDSQQTE